MDYRRLETLVIITGAILVIAGLLLAPAAQPYLWQEIATRAFTLVVLAAAAHWGRDGGAVAAALAIVAYIALRIPDLSIDGVTPDMTRGILAYGLTYGALGVIGGEVFGRLRYLVRRLGESVLLDDDTGVFNKAYCAQALSTALTAYQRYERPLSVVVVSLSPGLLTDLRPTAQRKILRSAASSLRHDMRIADDVGHLGQGRFLLILRETPRGGAEVVADRSGSHIRESLGAKETAVTAVVLSAPEGLDQMAALARSLEPSAEERQPSA